MSACIDLLIVILLWLFSRPANLYSVWISGKWLINWNWNMYPQATATNGYQLRFISPGCCDWIYHKGQKLAAYIFERHFQAYGNICVGISSLQMWVKTNLRCLKREMFYSTGSVWVKWLFTGGRAHVIIITRTLSWIVY